MQVSSENAIVQKRLFSEIDSLKVRESYSLVLQKTIYERLPFPSNRGGLERDFMLECDRDTTVLSFVKIVDVRHDFVRINYIRTDGLLAPYFPDFLVKTASHLFVVETKADRDVGNPNVQQKRRGTVDWVGRINALPTEQRDGLEWAYTILGETTFRSMRERGASIEEILKYSALNKGIVEGTLFDS